MNQAITQINCSCSPWTEWGFSSSNHTQTKHSFPLAHVSRRSQDETLHRLLCFHHTNKSRPKHVHQCFLVFRFMQHVCFFVTFEMYCCARSNSVIHIKRKCLFYWLPKIRLISTCGTLWSHYVITKVRPLIMKWMWKNVSLYRGYGAFHTAVAQNDGIGWLQLDA